MLNNLLQRCMSDAPVKIFLLGWVCYRSFQLAS